MPKWWYSTRESPRPRPSTARPPERWSRNAIFSTTRSGIVPGHDHGAGGELEARRAPGQPGQELHVVGAGRVVGEVVLGRPQRVEAERLG